MTRLKTEAARFLELFAERNAQNATIVTGATKAARLAADNAYRAAVKRLNALAEVNGDTDYIDVINAMNIPHRPADCHPQGTCHEERQQAEGRGDERATGGVTTYKIFFFHKHIICNKEGRLSRDTLPSSLSFPLSSHLGDIDLEVIARRALPAAYARGSRT